MPTKARPLVPLQLQKDRLGPKIRRSTAMCPSAVSAIGGEWPGVRAVGTMQNHSYAKMKLTIC